MHPGCKGQRPRQKASWWPGVRPEGAVGGCVVCLFEFAYGLRVGEGCGERAVGILSGPRSSPYWAGLSLCPPAIFFTVDAAGGSG